MSNVIYRIKVQDSNGDFIGEFDSFKNLQFQKRLNNYGSCQFDVPLRSSKAASLIALRQNTVWIYRNEVLIWSGEQVNRQGELDAQGNNWVTIYCFDWFEQLTGRYTSGEQTYTGVDAGAIAWDLIDTSQSQTHGDFGITEGTIATTQNRDRVYYNNNIADAIINLSNVINGFDFEINNSKIFNVYTEMGVDRTNDVVLEYGVNIQSMRITEDFSKPSNRAIVLGDSGNALDPLRVERNDTGLQALNKLREALINDQTVSEVGTLEDKGDALNRKYGTALLKVDFETVSGKTPTIEDLALGDTIRMIVKNGIYNIDGTFRVFQWDISYNEDDTERLGLLLGNFTV